MHFTLYPAALLCLGWILFSLAAAYAFLRAACGRRPFGARNALPKGERLEIRSPDGTRLAGRLGGAVSGPDGAAPLGVSVLLHDSGGTGYDMEGRAERYRERGWATLVTDLRAHGESGGRFSAMGALEAVDLAAWLDWAGDRFPRLPIIAHGIGTGASAAFRAALPEAAPGGYAGAESGVLADPVRPNLKGVILEYPDIDPGSRLRRTVGTLLRLPFLASTALASLDALAFLLWRMRVSGLDICRPEKTRETFGRIRLPALLFERGDGDRADPELQNLLIDDFLRRLS